MRTKTRHTVKTITKTETLSEADAPPADSPEAAIVDAYTLTIVYDMRQPAETAVAAVGAILGSPVDGRPSPAAIPPLTMTKSFQTLAEADAAYARLSGFDYVLSRTVQSNAY